MSSEDDSVNGEIDEIDLEVIQEDGDIEFQNQEEVEVNAEEQNAENSENPESQEKTVIKPKRGRGQEEHDLNLLMKTYEYWCHRLIPKFSFDDCITRLETLGSKRATQTHIKKNSNGPNC
ncbi:hypothetical protein NQ317_014258 [Molorchus minor]|uniref:TIMELESS-interacting protein n=1 Tax=Molorchus minor TaxID=1323400 RepID=A0ABQ9JF76_9CUCU|nr:hypothetical protein NQ317_014258 [Molorchus minor]